MIILVTREELKDLTDSMKDEIPFSDLFKFLPFATSAPSGYNFQHIRNEGIYDVETEKRTVEQGDTLCGRKSARYTGNSTTPCPGCLAIGRGLAVRRALEGR